MRIVSVEIKNVILLVCMFGRIWKIHRFLKDRIVLLFLFVCLWMPLI